MATTIAIKSSPSIKDPKWPQLTAKAGEEVEMEATPVNVTTQTSCFEIRNAAGQIVAVLDSDSTCKKKWTPPATPDDAEYTFYALLREKPTAANGYIGVLIRLESTNKLRVRGTKITEFSIDECFVPKQEKLVAKFKVVGELPAKGRIEIWGERYPTSKPLYTEDIVPAAENKWKWDGKKNDTAVAAKVGEYMSPQFSPYRMRIIVGPDEDSVKEPYAKGLGLVTMAEIQFGITIQSIEMRVMKDLNEGGEEKYWLRNALTIEKDPAVQDGTFAAVARLPKTTEKARIRIPLATHWGTGQNFDQAGNQNTGANLNRDMNYSAQNRKYAIDANLYTRPEIPVEFVVRLRSRKFAGNPASEKNKLGRFEPEALGPVRLEPFAEDNYLSNLYAGGDAIHQTFWKNAAFKVKQGANQGARNPAGRPVNSGGQPRFYFWQARFKVVNDGEQDFNVGPDLSFTQGQNELTVYLDRTRLEVGTNDQFNKKWKHYKETGNSTIQLIPGLTKQDQILWIVRKVAAPAVGAVVPKWSNYPPGTNCHEFYGGSRAKDPNNLFRKDYTAAPGGGHEPIIGKGATAFDYNALNHVVLAPDPAPAPQQERVEVQAMITGAKKGLAGIIFSPSYIGGDSYILHSRIEQEAYTRAFGCVAPKPQLAVKTGSMTVWRICHVYRSIRLPDVNTVGLRNRTLNVSNEVIFDSPVDPGDPIGPGRDHPGDSINMKFSVINRHNQTAFNEWTIRKAVPVIAATNANPIQVTAPGHGLVNADCIKIFGVPGNTAANGIFVIDNVAGDSFELHQRYDFARPSGVSAAGVAGNGVMPASVSIKVFADVAVSAATNEAPIKVTTGAAHGLTTGDEVIIKDVPGNIDANGKFKVTRVSDTEITLDESDGIDGDPSTAGGTLKRTNVTNSNPIAIITDGNHNLSTGDRVYINGVNGNTSGNGLFKVTVVNATSFTLDDSDGTAGGEYTNGGTVQSCGVIDVHRGVNLKLYRDTYAGIAGLNRGKVLMPNPTAIQMQFAPNDHYREELPPNLPAGYRNVASNKIHTLPAGTTPPDAKRAVADAILAHIARLEAASWSIPYGALQNVPLLGGFFAPTLGVIPPDLAPYPKLVKANIGASWDIVRANFKAYVENAAQDAALTAPVAIPISMDSPDDYQQAIDTLSDNVGSALLAVLTPPNPSSAQPKSLPVVRWPEFFHHAVWHDAKTNNIGLADFDETSVFTEGFCSPRGWAMFESEVDDPAAGLFTHEMGHSCHLSHFVVDGNDFNWKQHHLLSGNCLMSYNHTSAYLPKPAGSVGPTGGGSARDTGWPHLVRPVKPAEPPPAGPGPWRPDSLSIAPGVATGHRTIAYYAPMNAAGPCAKCVLKLRGWDDEVVPCAWNHPDLY